MTLLQPELVAQLAAAFPDAVAWRNLADGTELTLRDWHRRSNRLARGLQEQGLGRGDRVGLLIGNDEPLEWLVSYLAIHKAGAVAVPLLARLSPVELARILQDAGASLVLCSEVSRGDPGRGRDGGVHRTGRHAAVGRPALCRRSRPAAGVRPGRRGRHHVHLGDDRAAQGRRRPARRALDDRTACPRRGWGSASCPPRPSPRPAGRSSSRGPLRGGLSGWFLPRFDADGLDRRGGAGPPCRGLPRARHGGAHRRLPPLRGRRPLEPGRGHGGQRADCRGDPAPLRSGPARGGGPVRLRHDGVRCGHGHADGRRRTAPRLRRAPAARRGDPDRGTGRPDAVDRRGRGR